MANLNREALKTLANFNIDSQTFYQKAIQVFSYNGEMTPEYKSVCIEVKDIFNDMESSLKILRPIMDNLNSGN